MPALVLKPAMAAAVQVQQHAGQRASRPPLAMRPTLATFLHQPRSLQRQLHPGVAQRGPVLLPQLLVEVPHVEGEYLESCVWGAAAVGAVEMWESGAFCRISKRGGKSGKLAF